MRLLSAIGAFAGMVIMRYMIATHMMGQVNLLGSRIFQNNIFNVKHMKEEVLCL